MSAQPTLNRIPPGLLDLLDLKTLGRNPDALGSVVAPTLDLLPQYLLTRRQLITPASRSGIAADGFYIPGGPATDYVVPETEVWYVWAVNLVAECGPASGFMVNPYVIYPAGPIGIQGVYNASAIVGNIIAPIQPAPGQYDVRLTYAVGTWWTSGMYPGARVINVGGVNNSLTWSILATRLRV